MLDDFIILGITVGTLAVFAYLNRRFASSLTHEGTWVFRYPVHIRWLPVVALVIVDSLFIWDSLYRGSADVTFIEAIMKEPWKGLAIQLGALAAWLYLYFRKVILTDESITLVWAFGRTVMPFDEITRIVRYKSEGNPGAAMTKLYTPKALGNKKIRLEALMQGYDQAVSEVRSHAKNAEFVEK